MGLSERKVKQRIGADPRNLTWAENAAKFGHTYLSKLGWTPDTGLGVSGEGRTSNISVAQKLNLLGIGAGRKEAEKDGIAWKQSKDFEGVLERLNREREQESQSTSAEGDAVDLGEVEEIKDKEDDGSQRKSKKKSKHRTESLQPEDPNEAPPNDSDTIDAEPLAETRAKGPRRMAHRARFLASKQMVASSPQALAEILGVSAPPTPPLATSGNPTPGTLTPISDDLIKTSSMSVADYFKEKMRAKLASSSALKPTAEESREDPSVAADIQTSPDGNSSRREEIDQEPGVPTCDVEAKKKRKKSKRSREPAEEGIPSVETSRVEDDETERRERKRRKKEEKKLKKSKDEKGRANEDSD